MSVLYLSGKLPSPLFFIFNRRSKFIFMKMLLFSLVFSQLAFPVFSQVSTAPPEVQVKLALLSAPEDKRDSATVLGYSGSGKLVVLKQGTNQYICLADDPAQSGFSVACYHRDL